MDTVAFTRMIDGTAEEYAFLEELEHAYAGRLPQRIERSLAALEHSLQRLSRQPPRTLPAIGNQSLA